MYLHVEIYPVNVYCLYFPNGKRYVGTESKPGKRIKDHRYARSLWSKHPQVVHRAIKKYGWDNVQWRYLATNCSHEEAWKLEQFFIREMHLQDKQWGYNLSAGGPSPALGVKQSPEIVERRAAKKRGKPHTKEHCQHLSEALKGRAIKPEWVKKAIATKLARGLIRDPATRRVPNGDGRFKKGLIPWNKGTKGLIKANSGSFKPGNTPPFPGTKGVLKSWNKGLPTPEGTRCKQSAARMGKSPWNKGVKTGKPAWNAGLIALPAGPHGETRYFRAEQLI